MAYSNHPIEFGRHWPTPFQSTQSQLTNSSEQPIQNATQLDCTQLIQSNGLGLERQRIDTNNQVLNKAIGVVNERLGLVWLAILIGHFIDPNHFNVIIDSLTGWLFHLLSQLSRFHWVWWRWWRRRRRRRGNVWPWLILSSWNEQQRSCRKCLFCVILGLDACHLWRRLPPCLLWPCLALSCLTAELHII